MIKKNNPRFKKFKPTELEYYNDLKEVVEFGLWRVHVRTWRAIKNINNNKHISHKDAKSMAGVILSGNGYQVINWLENGENFSVPNSLIHYFNELRSKLIRDVNKTITKHNEGKVANGKLVCKSPPFQFNQATGIVKQWEYNTRDKWN